MAEPELAYAFCLVLATKQDLPSALSPSQVAERLRLVQVLAGKEWTCLPGCMNDISQQQAHFDWMVNALREARRRKAAQPVATTTPGSSDAAAAATHAANGGGGSIGGKGPGGPGGEAVGEKGRGGGGGGESEADVLERWLLVEDEPDEEFLQKLEKFRLSVWDHRTHLRLAWLYLQRHGRREGLARIHSAIQAFIRHSPLTRRKTGTTYHETMTYFWSHMVHFAMESMKAPKGAPPDFRTFLVLNPQLSNGGLFLHYYTKKLMLETPEARVKVILPDKRPLPSIITDISSLSIKQASPVALPAPAAALSDADFLQRFLARSLDKWSHECLLRAIYCCLKAHGRQRGGNIALDGLREMQKSGFHLTINYFWLAVLTHTLMNEDAAALFPERNPGGEQAKAAEAAAEVGAGGSVAVPAPSTAGQQQAGPRQQLPEWQELLQRRGYTTVRLKELLADNQHYLRYYSKQVVFGGAAAVLFTPPDKRPLPSTV